MAARFRVSPRTVRDWVAKGYADHHWHGRRRYLSPADVEALTHRTAPD